MLRWEGCHGTTGAVAGSKDGSGPRAKECGASSGQKGPGAGVSLEPPGGAGPSNTRILAPVRPSQVSDPQACEVICCSEALSVSSCVMVAIVS